MDSLSPRPDPIAYGRLLRTPSVARLAACFLALGVASTMTPVAFVLFARDATHSFARASLVLAAFTAGGLLLGPFRGRLVDRLGPATAILALAIPDVLTDIGFVIAGRADLGTGLLVALTLVAGAVTAPAGAALRSVWSQMLAASGTRQAGYALMTMMTETTFIAGPLLAGGLIAIWSPTAAVLASALLSFIGAVGFATAPGTRRVQPKPGRPGRLPALAGKGIRTVAATSAAFGLTFGVLDVTFPAFARTHGSAGVAGILLSAFAVGSWIGGFIYGLRLRAGSAGHQYPWWCLLAALGLAPLILRPGLGIMVALAGLSGICFAPVTTCQMAVIDEAVDARHKAEAFTWLGTMYGAGLALGAALAGQLITAAGTRSALALACGATASAWLVSVARAQTLRVTEPLERRTASPASAGRTDS